MVLDIRITITLGEEECLMVGKWSTANVLFLDPNSLRSTLIIYAVFCEIHALHFNIIIIFFKRQCNFI